MVALSLSSHLHNQRKDDAAHACNTRIKQLVDICNTYSLRHRHAWVLTRIGFKEKRWQAKPVSATSRASTAVATSKKSEVVGGKGLELWS